MYDFNNTSIQVSTEDILSKISEYDIFRKYIYGFIDFNKSFCSELRVDSRPDCRIYIGNDDKLRYKDFAEGTNVDCWNYVMLKFGCNYYEALNIIANDFNIKHLNYKPEEILISSGVKKQVVYEKIKSRIEIKSQPFNLIDFNYWNQYCIPLDLLESYNVFSAKYVYLYKGDKRYINEYSKNNPIYAYRFSRPGSYSYKIYKPLESNKQFKWLFSGGAADDIEGYNNLPLNGDILILTKSLKDCICYNLLGLPAISLQGEANKLEQELVDKLLKRFNKIIINYDPDLQGLSSTNKLVSQYSNFKFFFIDNEKDLSDYIKVYGLDKAKKLINKKLKCLI